MRVPLLLCVLLFLLLLGETSAGRKRKGEKDGGKKRDELQTRSGRLKKPVSSSSSSISSLWELKEDDPMEEAHCEDVAEALRRSRKSLMEDCERATRQDYPSTPGVCSSRDCPPDPGATSSLSSSSLQAEPHPSKTDEAQKKIPQGTNLSDSSLQGECLPSKTSEAWKKLPEGK
uniref:Uncharacterized protein n=1 Tax=Chromera velia CCMP2878 TaxID=1169474 RepID=A0A0G4HK67_9ALVE|eukprot:Cvel_28362.t1-p1 / transcript=Cvel_28362.t1 / gene=Cvel_28362 / organism=Chromera_velia_CCMP2878 / gene_product=hypothetical protein / transcript_product=hypothetical protein / location=Cvel_scaffold3696:2780-4115(+) / protein_length=173 / sequence_SO=supercontig / SO=protein_coding / is_pseudo=false